MPKRRRTRPGKINPHDIETEGLPSASGFDSEFRCPGKRALCARLPRDEDTSVQARGHRIHEALAKGDFSDLAKTEGDHASRIAYGESEIVHEYGFEGALIEFEERVWDFDSELNKTWSGKIDRYDWLPNDRRLLVLDDKTGWTTPPPVAMNWQVRSEGALLAERLDAVETIVGLIHPHHPDSLWEAKAYTRAQTDRLLEIVRHNVRKIQLPDQPRVYGAIQCQWCKAKRICPEYIAANERLDQAIADEIADGGFTAINRRSKQERGEHVRQLKEKIRNIEFILSQYVELAERDPEAITGWRLTRKLTRDVTDEVKAMEIIRANYGPDVLYACLKLSVKTLEDTIAKNSTRKDAKRSIETALRSVLIFKKSKYYLDEAKSL